MRTECARLMYLGNPSKLGRPRKPCWQCRKTVAVWSAIVPRGYVDGVCDLSGAPDVSRWNPKGWHPEQLVGNVVRPGPFGRPPWLGVTLMKCANHRQDSYPDNVGHWRCSVALGVLLTKVSARLRKEPTNTFGKSQPRSRQYQSRPEIDAGIGDVLNGRKQCRYALRPQALGPDSRVSQIPRDV
jgi:hypothetical protein